ncbi:carbon monoxide dehydrogenase [bacterium]|nr:MAG: carbon monoxide dehydrogenase [bacterium]
MAYVIAIAGKGGTGKTSLAGLLVKLLKEKKLGSVLAVDADPNSNLAEVLGIELKETIGTILDRISRHPEMIPVGMAKDRFIEYQVQSAIQENDGFDLLTMGRPEGPGCYCYVNNVLRNLMAKLIRDYDYVIIDNEAGLEHFSRRTTRSADILLVISDATAVALRAAARISLLAKELEIKTKRKFILINRFDRQIDRIKELDLEYIGNIPLDRELAKLSIEGKSLLGLANDSISLTALRRIGDRIWRQN